MLCFLVQLRHKKGIWRRRMEKMVLWSIFGGFLQAIHLYTLSTSFHIAMCATSERFPKDLRSPEWHRGSNTPMCPTVYSFKSNSLSKSTILWY